MTSSPARGNLSHLPIRELSLRLPGLSAPFLAGRVFRLSPTLCVQMLRLQRSPCGRLLRWPASALIWLVSKAERNLTLDQVLSCTDHEYEEQLRKQPQVEIDMRVCQIMLTELET